MTHFRRVIFDFRSRAGRVTWFPTWPKCDSKSGILVGTKGLPHMSSPTCPQTWYPAPGEASSPLPAPHNLYVVQRELTASYSETGRSAAAGKGHNETRGPKDNGLYLNKLCGKKQGKGNTVNS